MKTEILLIILTILFFLSCRNERKVEVIPITNYYSLADMDEANLKFYSIKKILRPTLDTVIESVSNCNRYDNFQVSYVVNSLQDTLNMLHVNISNNTDQFAFNYSICNGIFYYRGYQFVFIGTGLDSMLINLDKKKKLFYLNPKKLKNLYSEHGEFFHSSWDFIYENGNFTCISYTNCEKFWNDTKYLHFED